MINLKIKKKKIETVLMFLVFIEIAVFTLFFSFFSSPVIGEVGTPNATVATTLTVVKVAPEVLNVSIDNGNATVILTGNTTKIITCVGIIRDWDNYTDIENVTARFFDNYNSTYSDLDDNNEHYKNDSCVLNNSYDGIYFSEATCTFSVWYYANPTQWNCTIVVTDNTSQQGQNYDLINISELLSVLLPDTLDYGTVNSTYVSAEKVANVSNVGNVRIDLNLEGYGISQGDGLAMNCSRGNVGNISVGYEAYNLTEASSFGNVTLTQLTDMYINLTSAPVLEQFDLDYRFNDTINEAWNESYWRIYAPLGVAGTCNGSIIFGAVKS